MFWILGTCVDVCVWDLGNRDFEIWVVGWWSGACCLLPDAACCGLLLPDASAVNSGHQIEFMNSVKQWFVLFGLESKSMSGNHV